MLSKKLIKEVCIHEASHLFLVKILGYEAISMELYPKEGFARVAHRGYEDVRSHEAAIKTAGYLADKIISKKNVKFNNAIYATQIVDDGIRFGDYDEFKLAGLTKSQERKIIRIVTAIVTKNKKKIKAVADFFISKMDKDQYIVVGKHRLHKLFKDLGILEEPDIAAKLNIL